MQNAQIQQDSTAWKFFVVISFIFALATTSFGVLILPVELWVKGYMAMGLYFSMASSFMLAKTIRDAHESDKLVNKVNNARTSKMLNEFDIDS